MATQVQVGSFVANTTTGNQSVTGVGFQPKVVIFFGNKLTADGNIPDATMYLGAAVSSTNRRVNYFESGDNLDVSNIGSGAQTTACIRMVDYASTVLLSADLVSMDSDGFTINIGTTSGSAYIVNYIALGGDISNAFLGSGTSPTTTGNKSYTGVGFQPDCLLLWSERSKTTETREGSNVGIGYGIGLARTATEQFTSAFRVEDALTTSSADRQRRTHAFYFAASTSGGVEISELVSLDPDGFTLNWLYVAGSERWFYYLALRGGAYRVGTFNQPTSTGTQGITGIGFAPRGVMLLSALINSGSISAANMRGCIGAASGPTARGSIWFGDADAQAFTVSDQALDRARVLKFLTEGTPTLDAEADLASLDSDGFTLNWTTADANARQIEYLAFGDGAAPSVSIPVLQHHYASMRY